MLKSQEIQLAQSKRREKMASIQKADEISDEGRTELRSLTDAYEGAEVELRAAILLEQAERDKIKEPDKATSDFDRECRAFNIAALVESLEGQKPLSGREAEVSQELEERHGAAAKGVRFPWEALLETRADATISAPDASSGDLATRPTMKALERVFEDSAAARFGFRTIAVTGQPRFPELTGGASASWVAEGEGADAAAITTSVTSPTIKTLTARYLLSRQAIRQNAVLETMLRRDLSEVLREALDLACFRGTGADNQPSGLDTLLTGESHAAVITYADVVDWATDLMVSSKANDMGGISIAGVPFMMADLLKATFGDILTQLEQARKVVPNMVFSSQVSEVTAGSPDSASLYVGKPDQHAWVPTWGSPELLVDPYSESKTGKVALTVFSFTDILVQRQATHFKQITNVQKAA
ncbi:phage capsid family protein [Antarctobacter heliothermus]|uniref:Phage capsid family protein n=1 Tax=Antarctobacter heliothermus TaxID=74033 RepID=A0A222E788_9RHOB|nr:phage major capsid protein [Antarctobacter heliothermus]ASP22056.1 phage capsid family protein [Antarctobacter heliothermus]